MPVGNADCCGTCCFNSANHGRARVRTVKLTPSVRCTVRDLTILNPVFTYCANHPKHNPDRVAVPLGPVYVSAGGFFEREVEFESPDTEEIRLALLEELAKMEEVPPEWYLSCTQLEEEVIKQLMAFREVRAVPDLRRICAFDPLTEPEGENRFGQSRATTVCLAVAALAKIDGAGSLDVLGEALNCGLPEGARKPIRGTGIFSRLRARWALRRYEPASFAEERLLAVRYHAVIGLAGIKGERANYLLRVAANDPAPPVAALAHGMIRLQSADA